MGEWGIAKDSPAGRRALAQGLERRRSEDTRVEFQEMERGFCVGDEEFARELLDGVATNPSRSYFGCFIGTAKICKI